ncbi:NAD(P)/FAD-dependent oxidoreductase [Streptomonospora nanhaiensis]|uniref:Glycine/D-amino acid oxidase-like deaminating enzyme n=1 Tax=Streptomonospora nanhaiensis TaxID=1323731 RepID=A0A853BTW0_9ACTN|nr:FAD-dependent oxidoreductase [Streptomonospora nanhaiensis]MBV2365447.1 FAD-binding oxidoreductase [Streptomonospora nanhaiensis]MBX9389735.1 FAD-binding oxidoreductase [Streptomonospora nanhaiensis]NYI98394.1 glycine/D-amino acid oxidase-like deaminating enzyme [Streptomonospora nanhaiensis]
MRAVAVVGAGIVGAATAWNLARRGLRVTVVERAPVPGAGASGASFARATAFGRAPRAYFELRHAGLRTLDRLRETGVPGFRPCPSLVWSQDDPALAETVATARHRGYRACHRPCDQLPVPTGPGRAVPAARAAYLPAEGWVDLPAMADWMLARARRFGADIRFGGRAAGVRTGGDGAVRALVLADGGAVEADTVVNAAGAQADQVARLVGGPLVLAPSAGLLAEVPLARELDAMLLAPDVSIRPAGPNAALLRSDAVDARLGAAPSAALVAELAAELVDRAAAVLPELAGARPAATRVGVRAFPADGYPSVGFLSGVPGYYEAVTHSGATLGPLLGRLAAEEIASGHRSRLLAPYTPDRFGGSAVPDQGAGIVPAHT